MVVGFSLLHGSISLVRALIGVLVTAELFVHVRRYGVAFHRRENARDALDVLSAHAGGELDDTGPLIEATDLRTAAGETRVDLRVESGTHVLVTGPSGCGKTTLLRTLLGWTPPSEGHVRRRRARVAHVSAESALLSRSLWDNVTLGVEHDRDDVRALLDSLGLSGARFSDLDVAL